MARKVKENDIRLMAQSEDSNGQVHQSSPLEAPNPGAMNASLSEISLDDAAMLIPQIEAGDLQGFGRLRDMLTAIIDSATIPEAELASLEQSCQLLNRLLDGEISDTEEVLREITRRLEEAGNSREIKAVSKHAAPAPVRPEPVPGVSYSIASEIKPESPQFSMVESTAAAAAIPVTKAIPAPSFAKPPVEDFPSQLPADADADLLKEFINESREYIASAEAALLSLENDPDNQEAINTVFRAFHTIKGTSGFLSLKPITQLAHRAESLLSRARDREIRCTGGYADLALRSVDMLNELIQDVQNALRGQPLIRPTGYDVLNGTLANPEAAGVSEEGGETSAESLRLGDILVAEGKISRQKVESVAQDQGTQHIGMALLQSDAATLTDVAQALRVQKNISKAGARVDSSVRVSTERLDRLVDMVGELVIAQSMVAQDETIRHGSHHELLKKVTHSGKIVRELQDLSMAMRMVPLKATFQKMTRLVRDLCVKSGKKVNLITDDKDTEIDRNMVDIINDLLVHMVRNAVDHGIELPEIRAQAGKDPTGTVILSAFHSGGKVVVEIQDDGKGLDRNKIVKKALAKGLLESDKNLSDNDIYSLIFAPGFSTAEEVTDISGRGVGMDVVRRGVESLRGQVDIISESGKGCKFSIRLPLTLAITDGMLVKVGPEQYIIPTVNISVSFRPGTDALSTIAGRGEMVLLRGELLPLFRLHRLFNVPGAILDPTQALLVVVGESRQRCALMVDELLGQQQVVAKSLGEGIGKIKGIAGGAILGNGCVGLILDPSAITVLAREVSSLGDEFTRVCAA